MEGVMEAKGERRLFVTKTAKVHDETAYFYDAAGF